MATAAADLPLLLYRFRTAPTFRRTMDLIG
jgi:hypothetical protein